jgi:transient receptor potential cation channel subfamily C member 4
LIEAFVSACERGDYVNVCKILDCGKSFDIDKADSLGRTGLSVAIKYNHIQIFRLLLDKAQSEHIRTALLLAIYTGRSLIVDSILKNTKFKVLKQKNILNGSTDLFWNKSSSDDAQFSPDITPIMLASQFNRIEIIQMLLMNGDCIPKPHSYSCECTECTNKTKFDSLRHAQSRLNSFKGLVSPSLISLASKDPILTAFELGCELKLLSDNETYFRVSKINNNFKVFFVFKQVFNLFFSKSTQSCVKFSASIPFIF